MPGHADPQNLNRYSYTRNNPLRYIDPTGHKPCGDGEPWDCNGYAQNPNQNPHPPKPPSPPKSDNSSSGNHPPIVIPNLPCGGMMTCGQQNPYAYAASTLPFTSSDACYFFLQDPVLCSSSSWQNLPNVTVASGPTSGTSPYAEHFPWHNTIPSFFNPGFSPNADDIWNDILGVLPLLGSRPATTLNQVIINTVNNTSNALTNIGSAANVAIGNGPNYGPVMPIFYIPSPYDLFPVTSQQPVYN